MCAIWNMVEEITDKKSILRFLAIFYDDIMRFLVERHKNSLALPEIESVYDLPGYCHDERLVAELYQLSLGTWHDV